MPANPHSPGALHSAPADDRYACDRLPVLPLGVAAINSRFGAGVVLAQTIAMPGWQRERVRHVQAAA